MNPDERSEDCHFLPIHLLEEVISDNIIKKQKPRSSCQKSLLFLQNNTPTMGTQDSLWRNAFYGAICRAVCAHDWVKLQTFLAEYPLNSKSAYIIDRSTLDIYLRGLLFLLMYHPNAKAQSLLHQFMHMVLGVRTDEEKKAFTKLILALPDKFVLRQKSK